MTIRDFQMSLAIVSIEMAQIGIPIHYEMVKRSTYTLKSSVHLYCVQVPRVIRTQARTFCIRTQSAWSLNNGCN